MSRDLTPPVASGLARFLEHAQRRGHVWFATRGEITRHWRAEHPPARP